jgi:hypothetical protein
MPEHLKLEGHEMIKEFKYLELEVKPHSNNTLASSDFLIVSAAKKVLDLHHDEIHEEWGLEQYFSTHLLSGFKKSIGVVMRPVSVESFYGWVVTFEKEHEQSALHKVNYNVETRTGSEYVCKAVFSGSF